MTGAAFWALMTRWRVADAQALALIDQPASPSGKRPRFALTTEQSDRLRLLLEIERQAELLGLDAPHWLGAGGKTSPLATMIGGGRDGIAAVLHRLQLRAFGARA